MTIREKWHYVIDHIDMNKCHIQIYNQKRSTLPLHISWVEVVMTNKSGALYKEKIIKKDLDDIIKYIKTGK